jgi:hypothetical protein
MRPAAAVRQLVPPHVKIINPEHIALALHNPGATLTPAPVAVATTRCRGHYTASPPGLAACNWRVKGVYETAKVGTWLTLCRGLGRDVSIQKVSVIQGVSLRRFAKSRRLDVKNRSTALDPSCRKAAQP